MDTSCAYLIINEVITIWPAIVARDEQRHKVKT